MIKTYETKHFWEVVGLLSKIDGANQLETPPPYFKDIVIKPIYGETGRPNKGFQINVWTETEKPRHKIESIDG